MSSARQVTELLRSWSRGDQRALEQLTPMVYAELRRLARRRMSRERSDHTLQVTALVHEAYLRLVNNNQICWSSRAQFYAAAAEAMRRILIEHARKRNRLKRGGGRRSDFASVLELASNENLEDAVAFSDAIDRLADEDPRAALVTRLRFYAGLTVEETARAIGVSERTVMREWNYARAWLHDVMAFSS